MLYLGRLVAASGASVDLSLSLIKESLSGYGEDSRLVTVKQSIV